MIRIYNISLKQDINNPITFNSGYALYGALFKDINREQGDFFHHDKITHIAHHVEIENNNCALWKIALFGYESISIIAPVLENLSQMSLYGNRVTLKINNIQFTEYDTPQIYFEKNLPQEKSNMWKMKFVTPTTFKSSGEYVLYPTVDLILKNLMKRYCAFFDNIQTDENMLIEKIIPYTKIVTYSLKSIDYPMKNTKIPSFIGELEISTSVKDSNLKFLTELICFANIAGVGIKTALGMGGTIC